MRMFWKLFLSFWLTILLGGAMSFVAISTFGQHLHIGGLLFDGMAHRVDEHFTRLTVLYGQAALQLYRNGSRAEYDAFVHGLFKDAGIEITLIGPDNRSSAGDPLSSELMDLVERARHAPQALVEKTDNGLRIVGRLAGQNGETPPIVMGQLAFGPPPGIRPPGGKEPPFLARLLPPFFRPGEIVRTAVMLLVVSVVCYLLARSLATPIRRLQQTARRIAGGDYSARVGAGLGRPGNELAELGRDFDIMVERTEAVIDSQKRLLRDISHELRSPLARLHVALELAKKRFDAGEDSALSRIGAEADQLNELIDHLLVLSRMEAKTGSDVMEPVDLTGLLREVVTDADFEAAWSGRGVEIIASTDVTVMGCRELLRRAVENIIRNGARYTAPRTRVEIILAVRDAQVLISVRDHGPGVPEADLPHLFEPFYRVAKARERQTGGTGLGLAIALQAIKAHGGTIAAQNALPPPGLQVTISLP